MRYLSPGEYSMFFNLSQSTVVGVLKGKGWTHERTDFGEPQFCKGQKWEDRAPRVSVSSAFLSEPRTAAYDFVVTFAQAEGLSTFEALKVLSGEAIA